MCPTSTQLVHPRKRTCLRDATSSGVVWRDDGCLLPTKVDSQAVLRMPHVQFTTTAKFLDEVFVPKAAARGAIVESTVLETAEGGNGSIGAAICGYVAKVTLILSSCDMPYGIFCASANAHLAASCLSVHVCHYGPFH